MVTLKDFVFFDETSTATLSNPMCNTNRGEELVFQVTGDDVNIVMHGVADVEEDDKYPLMCVNYSDMSITNEIREAGIYAAPAHGINRFICENKGDAGSVKVYGKLLG